MKYKALAFDLDGTLLIGEALPEPNRLAVRAAFEAGYRIIIATARWRQMAQRIEAQIGISGPAITCSGAQVYCPDIGGDVFDERLPADFTNDLYAICDAERCIATVTVDDRVLLKLDGKPEPGLFPEGSGTHGLPVSYMALDQRLQQDLGTLGYLVVTHVLPCDYLTRF